MRKDNVYLPHAIKLKIQAQAKEEYPFECCGILFGKKVPDNGRKIDDYVRVQNECCFDDKNRHFRLDPLKLYEFEKRYREKGLDIFGFFHSHPDAPAVLSIEDEQEMIPGLLYMIAEVQNGDHGRIRVWKKDQPKGIARELSIRIIMERQ